MFTGVAARCRTSAAAPVKHHSRFRLIKLQPESNMHHLVTEQPNTTSADIDTLSTCEIVKLMNAEDHKVALAVELVSGVIVQAVDAIASRLVSGGRLFYLGAGTSGRLGVLDASECPPTFNTPPEMVIGIIAGGPKALTTAIEGAEDDTESAIVDLKAREFSNFLAGYELFARALVFFCSSRRREGDLPLAGTK